MRKLTLLLVGGLGYVLGARAGRQRYEQIRGLVVRVKENPKVQQTAAQAAGAAKTAAPVVKEKVSGAASAAASKVGGSSSDDSASTTTTTSTTATTTGANGVPLEDSAYPNGMTPPTS